MGQAASLSFPIDIDEESTFSGRKGQIKKSLVKSKSKLLEGLGPQLQRSLQPNEKVLHVSKALSPYNFFEAWTSGWAIYSIKKSTLVFTDRRILHFPTSRSKTKHSVSEIHYGDIVSSKAFFNLVLKYKNGEKDYFRRLKWADSKKALSIIERYRQGAQSTRAGGRVHLCPSCSEKLKPNVYSCGSCQFAFKDRSTALRWSLIFPGGGYFYTGHPFMGIADALVEGVLIFAAIGAAEESLVQAGVILAILVAEKAVTIYHCLHYLKEYIPVDASSLKIHRVA